MTKKIIVALSGLFLLASCKKQIENNVQKTESEGQSFMPNAGTHEMGLLPVAQEAYSQLIKPELLKQLKSTRTTACTSVDLTPLLPAPGDQGLQGSCVSWAVGYYAKSYWEAQETGWALNTNAHYFSPQYIYSQTHVDNNFGGGGSYFSAALNLVTAQGVSTLNVCPYNPNDAYGFTVQPTGEMRRQAFRFKNASWSALPYRDVNDIRDRLCNNQPVLLGIPVYPDFDNLWAGNDTYDDLSGIRRGFHAITLIGYDDGRQAFRFVNQWGTNWGLNGYGWISYDLIANNNFENYVMFDAPNPIYVDTWDGASTAGVSNMGYYSGDVNGDGNTDVIQPWNNGGTLAIIAHNVSGNSTNIICNNTMPGIGTGNVGFVPADVNGDGKTDFVQGWNNGGKMSLIVFTSTGTSFYQSWNATTTMGAANIRLLPVDMDGDGKTDIAQLWNNNGNLGLIIYRSTGTGYALYYSTVFANGSANIGFFPADYDGDGKTDIVQCWNNNGLTSVSVFRSSGTSYTNAWNGTMSQGAGNAGFVPVDYNGDNKSDFIQAWNNTGMLNLLLYNSSGSGYSFLTNNATRQGAANIGLLPAKTAGNNRTGFIQVWNNNNATAFIKYEAIQY